MMAVDFDVSGSTLRIQGDSADDSVWVFGTGAEGSVALREGGNNPVYFDGIRSVRIDLKDGDDALIVSGLKIKNDLTVRMGDGTDTFDLNAAPPVTEFLDVVIGDDVYVHMGNDARDAIVFNTTPRTGKSLTVEDDVVLRGAASVTMLGGPVDGESTTEFEAEDIAIGDRLSVAVSGNHGDDMYGPPEMRLRDVNVGGKTRLVGSRASDEIVLEFSNFHDEFSVNTGAGDDVVIMEHVTRFGDRAKFAAGSGIDAMWNQERRVLTSSYRDHGFELYVEAPSDDW